MDINKERSGSKKFIQRNGRAAKEGRGKGKKIGRERRKERKKDGEERCRKKEDRRRERRERGTWQDRGKRGS